MPYLYCSTVGILSHYLFGGEKAEQAVHLPRGQLSFIGRRKNPQQLIQYWLGPTWEIFSNCGADPG